jgi:hypothetical protein
MLRKKIQYYNYRLTTFLQSSNTIRNYSAVKGKNGIKYMPTY